MSEEILEVIRPHSSIVDAAPAVFAEAFRASKKPSNSPSSAGARAG